MMCAITEPFCFLEERTQINFLRETIWCLECHGKTETDVLWVGRGFGIFSQEEPYKATWEDFKAKADFKYDNGFGAQEIPGDLIIVGKDFWLERHEYDGQEWWEFKTMPTEPAVTGEIGELRY